MRFFLRSDSRWSFLYLLGTVILVINSVLRLGLMGWEADWANFAPLRLIAILAVGLQQDFASACWMLLPFALLALACPDTPRGRRVFGFAAGTLAFGGLFAGLFLALSEILFWNEFSSRFNFIAVDYLIYSREVLGNIRESYPVPALLGGVFALAALLYLGLRKRLAAAAAAPAGGWRLRVLRVGVLALLCAAPILLPDEALRDMLPSTSARELAGNGAYDFVRAFNNNDLDYRRYYMTLDSARAKSVLRAELSEGAGGEKVKLDRGVPVRQIRAKGVKLPLNVVLVSMESLGADYIESLGGRHGLTPNLDRLGAEGILFTQLYATGLRTVRGLEALTLSLPPTPGHAVPMRKRNLGLPTLGGVLKAEGYVSLYFYGGYAYFDNMRNFFGGNGYQVIDRTDIPRAAITHENIWGVADEDIFRHAIGELDRRTAAGQRVFAHIMTTSNHRPFTYPDGRVDIASGSGRDGAVKYSDWAIGEFLREARARPWFKDTLFVFVADHTSNGRGRVDLPPENYRIPAIFYSPAHFKPQRVDRIVSQIDIAPTLLGLLGLDYDSEFFGDDVLRAGPHHERAFMGNYLTVGYMQDGWIVQLMPKRGVRVVHADSGKEAPARTPELDHLVEEAVSYYQIATQMVRDVAH
ncbi:MAG: LTA synthase family protein [Rhodocyclaceae bacterium]|nr:LTA synthase family protein [Rhodocyclaceae bacterium]MBX3670308.1 LTA synthase family protein [Rhodocyclaceae bacterium]